ncbi:hypothetical protein RR46_15292 [Papilio xuthus]|uniref:Secreted protein n=1 Tax=Papilio xuthus TaxID=66420 RepID=A0A194PFI8_PAPXU|nr:hypothetical protein RR46_15292 [Papilio xuthus]
MTDLSRTILICLWRFALRSRRVYCGCAGGGAVGAGGAPPSGARLPMSTFNSAISFCTIRTRRISTAHVIRVIKCTQWSKALPKAISPCVTSISDVAAARDYCLTIDIDTGVFTTRQRAQHCPFATDALTSPLFISAR